MLPIVGGSSREGLGDRDLGRGGGGISVEGDGAMVDGSIVCSDTETVGGAGMEPLATSDGERVSCSFSGVFWSCASAAF